ncbi:hypothetical protein Hypma_005929 [Hypsizygus marmoreus]|uniref:CCHC-type domain-containing protein n=1 Tax=Hypsizygus marmoreus TaxID=39966 RepID=A0A369K7U7_HYPMA|nr:hypothetical protein Hypma_005929 [Hypsizygus marmoreus]
MAAPIVSAPVWRSGRSGLTSANTASLGPGDGASQALVNPPPSSTLPGAPATSRRTSWTTSSCLMAPTISSAGRAHLSAPLLPLRTSLPRDMLATNRTPLSVLADEDTTNFIRSTSGPRLSTTAPRLGRLNDFELSHGLQDMAFTSSYATVPPAHVLTCESREIHNGMGMYQVAGPQDLGIGSTGMYSPAPFNRPSPPSASRRSSPISSPQITPWATPHDGDDVRRHPGLPSAPIRRLNPMANSHSSTGSPGHMERLPRSPSIDNAIHHESSGTNSPFMRTSRSPQIEEIACSMAPPHAARGQAHDTTIPHSPAGPTSHAECLPRSPVIESLRHYSSPGRSPPLTRISRSPQIEEIARRMSSFQNLDLQAGTVNALTISTDPVASFLAANPAFHHVRVREEQPTSGPTPSRTPTTAALAPVDQEHYTTHSDPRSHERDDNHRNSASRSPGSLLAPAPVHPVDVSSWHEPLQDQRHMTESQYRPASVHTVSDQDMPRPTPAPLDPTVVHQLRVFHSDGRLFRDRMLLDTHLLEQTGMATFELHHQVDDLGREFTARVSSLKNEATGLHSRVNRVLDDNLQLLQETEYMNQDFDSFLTSLQQRRPISDRRPKRTPTPDIVHDLPTLPARPINTTTMVLEHAPPELIQEMDRIIPPRGDDELAHDYAHLVSAMRRNSERTRNAWAAGAGVQTTTPCTPALCRTPPHVQFQVEPDMNTTVNSSTDNPLNHFQQDNLPAHFVTGRETMQNHSTPDHTTYDWTAPILSTPMAGYSSQIPQPGLDIVQGHKNVLLDRIKQLIIWHVGAAMPPLPSGAKQPKIDNPSKYTGSDNHASFYTWLDQYLSWLRAHGVCGPESDVHRVNFMGQHLTGSALSWFTQEIDNPDRVALPYSFEQAVCAMHGRFIHSATAKHATTQFEHCVWSKLLGVEEFYNELLERAKIMLKYPSDYQIRRQFLSGLPKWIHNTMVVSRLLSAEFSSITVLRTNARQLEESQDLIDSTEMSDLIPNSNPLVLPPPRPLPSVPVAPSYDHDPVQKCPDDHDRSAAPSAHRVCYACNQPGHLANDPNCPKKRWDPNKAPGPRLKMAAMKIADPIYDNDGAGFWGGSQYTSSPDTIPNVVSLEPEHQNTDIRIGAMRT